MSYPMSGGKYALEERGYTIKRAVIGWLLGTIAGTWFGIWCSGPAAPKLRAHGLTLSTWAEKPWDAADGNFVGSVTFPGRMRMTAGMHRLVWASKANTTSAPGLPTNHVERPGSPARMPLHLSWPRKKEKAKTQ